MVRRKSKDDGMSTVEYVMGLMAAVGFAALFTAVMSSSAVREAVMRMVLKALT